MEISFGNWVRRRRKGLDLTQGELARRVGCSSSLIFKIETDERRPSRQIAELLAAQLEITGEQRERFLKAARQELAAFHLDEPDAPVSIPPARLPSFELAEPRHASLPFFPTAFVGRENEIAVIVDQLLDPACRLLTLTGPGGIGKTRLAVEVARGIENDFADGVHFLSMAGIEESESLFSVVADVLGITFSGPADPKLQLIQALRKRKALLVFDNMEHLISVSPALGEILEQAPGIRMLLTSREPIHLQWEWIFEVQGLPVPESIQPDILESNSAVALFLQRARQSGQQMALSSAEAVAVVQICRLVDGLPLAIELAASWARILSPSEIARELAGGLDLLETSLQDVPARHRSIRIVFDHSWKLLTEVERTALMRLAVFPGGFTREAAQEAASASVVLLSTLVSKSLLRYGKKAGRYDFHELVRQYVLRRLGEQPDLERSAYSAHAEYYAHWLGDLDAPLKSAQQIAVSARIRDEVANWSAAWRWSARQQRLDLLAAMAPCLYWYVEIHGDNAEGLASFAYAVEQLRAAGAPGSLRRDAEISAFSMLVTQLGWFEFRVGNVEQAVRLYKESLPLASQVETPNQYALYLVHINWGYLALLTGDIEGAARLLQQSLVHAQATGSVWNIAVSVNILGIVEYQRGRVAEAYEQLTDSLKMWREIGDLRGLVFCMLYLSSAALSLEDYDSVVSILNESNAIARQKSDRWAYAFGLDLLGHVAIARGEMHSAGEYFQQSMLLSQEIGDQWAATQGLIHLGEVQLALKDEAVAQRYFRQAYENARQAHWLPTILEVLTALLLLENGMAGETRLAITLAVLSHSAASLATRKRAENLRDQLASSLHPQQVDEAHHAAGRKTAEQWAGEVFQQVGRKSAVFDQVMSGFTIDFNQA